MIFQTNDHPELFAELAHDATRGLRGMERIAKLALACFFAKWRAERQESHHCLLQAINGTAKGCLAENTNKALLGRDLVRFYNNTGLRVPLRRVQGNPELMPSDLVGADLLGDGKKLVFVPGPLTAEFPPTFQVLADEINRTSPRTLSGWLQAMAEGACTVRSAVLDEPTLLFVPGWVLATQNPSQHVGTYPLPEAAYDRFMVMLIAGMTQELAEVVKWEPPETCESNELVARDKEEERALFAKRKLQLDDAKEQVGNMELDDGVAAYIARVCYWTWPLDAVRRLRLGTEELVCQRRNVKEAVELLTQGASPRAAKALRNLGCAMAWAFRLPKVTKELIAEIAEPVLAHRLVLRRSAGTDHQCSVERIVRTVVREALRS
jgi:MoxR-like ATPase